MRYLRLVNDVDDVIAVQRRVSKPRVGELPGCALPKCVRRGRIPTTAPRGPAVVNSRTSPRARPAPRSGELVGRVRFPSSLRR